MALNLYQLILQNKTQQPLVVFSYIYLKHNKLENVFHSFPENKIEIDITELKITSFVIGYFLSSSGIVIALQNSQIVC